MKPKQNKIYKRRKVVEQVDLTAPKVLLGNSSQAQLKKEALSWIAEAKSMAKIWDLFFIRPTTFEILAPELQTERVRLHKDKN